MESACSKSLKRSKERLPSQLLFDEILPRLPPTTLLPFKSVCKHWYKSISDPYFVKLHLNRCKSQPTGFLRLKKIGDRSDYYYQNATSRPSFLGINKQGYTMKLLASYDGLLLVKYNNISGDEKPDLFYVYNPVTDKAWQIPSPPKYLTHFKLFFDDAIDRYKIVAWCAAYEKSDNFIQIESFLLDRLCSFWKVLKVTDFTKDFTPHKTYQVNQKLFWVSPTNLVAMDITKDAVKMIEYPSLSMSRPTTTMCVVIEGSVYFLRRFLGTKDCFCVWVLEEKGEELKWMKLGETSVYHEEECNGDKIVHYNTLVDLDQALSLNSGDQI